MQNRQNGRRRRGSGGNNPRPMGQPMGGQNANRLEVRVRGNAHQLLDKYKVLARDAHQAGDRVAAEYYLQHADHYFRVLNDSRIRHDEMRARRGVFDQFEDDGLDMAGDDGSEGGQGDGGDDGDMQDVPQRRSRDHSPDRHPQDRHPQDRQPPDRQRGQRHDGDQRQERRAQHDPRERPEQRDRAGSGEQDSSDIGQERPRRWQQNRPQERPEDRGSHDLRPANRPEVRDETARDERERPRRLPRLRAEPTGSRISDGEAALIAFGGVPVRDPAGDVQAREVPAPVDAGGDDAPKPRRRGRPKKAEAEPVEG